MSRGGNRIADGAQVVNVRTAALRAACVAAGGNLLVCEGGIIGQFDALDALLGQHACCAAGYHFVARRRCLAYGRLPTVAIAEVDVRCGGLISIEGDAQAVVVRVALLSQIPLVAGMVRGKPILFPVTRGHGERLELLFDTTRRVVGGAPE